MSDNHDELELHKGDFVPQPKPQPEGRQSLVLKLLTISVMFLLLIMAWAIYLVNTTWWMGAVVILLPAALAYIPYKWWPELYWHGDKRVTTIRMDLALTGVCIINAWLVSWYDPTIVSVALLTVLVLAFIRSALMSLRGTEREAKLASFREIEVPKRVDDRLTLKLNPGERYRLYTKLHPIYIAKWVAAMVMWLILSIGLWTFTDISFLATVIVLAIGEVVPIAKVILWDQHMICLTTHYRLFIMEGILKKKTPAIDARKLTDSTPIIPRLSTILSWMRIIKAPYGYYDLENAGQDQAIKMLGPLPAIDAFERALTQMIAPPPEQRGDVE